MFSVSHEFKTDLHWILPADILKKQFIKFINPALLLYWKEKIIVQNLKQCVIYGLIFGFTQLFTVVVCSQSREPSFPEIIQTYLSFRISSSTCDFSKERPTDMWQIMSDTVRHYHCLLSDFYGHITSTVWIILRQKPLALTTSATVHLTVNIMLILTLYTELPQM